MQLILILLILAAAILAVRLLTTGFTRRRAMRRMDAEIDERAGAARGDAGWLTIWLSNAGYRDPAAAALFLAATAGGLALGLLTVWLLNRNQMLLWMDQALNGLPGGIGDAFQLVVTAAPWIILLNAVAAPALVVRAARRRRVAAIERDLTITLELLATLAEAGLGFDAGLARIQESETSVTPLGQELGIYQRDVLAGVPRLQALRQLGKRINITTVTIFISALAQAEQLGASLAETLRLQADDLRDRRKMQALIQAQALPVKLVFPLIICFLPGLFVSTLGPALYQLIKVVDGALRNAR